MDQDSQLYGCCLFALVGVSSWYMLCVLLSGTFFDATEVSKMALPRAWLHLLSCSFWHPPGSLESLVSTLFLEVRLTQSRGIKPLLILISFPGWTHLSSWGRFCYSHYRKDWRSRCSTSSSPLFCLVGVEHESWLTQWWSDMGLCYCDHCSRIFREDYWRYACRKGL